MYGKASNRYTSDDLTPLDEARRQETLQAWEHYVATGLHATAGEVEKWLTSWGTNNELLAPNCQM
jgi:hypothetical protein